jgi:hypothetical protein
MPDSLREEFALLLAQAALVEGASPQLLQERATTEPTRGAPYQQWRA